MVKATDKALCVELDEHGKDVWIPLSVLHDDSEVFDDDENGDGEVIVKSWWAEKENLV